MDNLNKRHVLIVDWFCMCKKNGMSVNYLLLYFEMASALWNTIFSLVWLAWVIRSWVVDLFTCWKRHFDRIKNANIWNMILTCLMGCLWKKTDDRNFEDCEQIVVELKDFSLKTFYHWTAIFDLNISSSHVLDKFFSFSS